MSKEIEDVDYAESIVDKLLREVDYSFPGFIPSKETFAFFNFIQLVHGGKLENTNPLVHYKIIDNIFNSTNKKHAILSHRGIAKKQKLTAPVLTPTGWSTIGNIKVGDKVMNMFGSTSSVIAKSNPEKLNWFKMGLSDGTFIEFGDEHTHILTSRKSIRGNKNSYTTRTMTTQEIFDDGLTYNTKKKTNPKDGRNQYKHKIPNCEPIQFTHKKLDIEPYCLGYALANGSFGNSDTISCHADDMLEIARTFALKGFSVGSMNIYGDHAGNFIALGKRFKKYNNIKSANRYIPSNYLFGSVEQRLELLRGLMDGDGSIAQNGGVVYDSFSEQLALDVQSLAQSLGAIAVLKSYKRKYSGRDGISTCFRVRINIRLNPFKLKRKANKWKPSNKKSRSIVSLEKIDIDEYGQCLVLDSDDKSYITTNYTITHNSTLMGVYLPLYIAVTGNFPGFGPVNYIIYVADSMENNVRTTMNTIRDVFESSDFLKEKFEVAKFTDTRLTLIRHQVAGENKAKSDRRLYLSGYGSSTGVRGTRKGSDRPQVALIDDLIKSNSDARSEAILRSIRETVFSDIKAAMHPSHQRIIWTGTPFNQNDPLYMAIESGAWEPSVYPVCEEIGIDLRKKDFKGSWEDRFTYESVMLNYGDSVKDGSVEEYMQEMMLRISSEENRLIDESKLIWFNKTDILVNKEAYNWYITTDLATRKEKTSDFAVILVWAINSKGDHLLVDGQAKRGEPNDHVEALFDYCQKYNPLSVGIEITGQQVTFVDMLRNKMIKENRYFNIHEQRPGKPGIIGSGRTSKYEKFLGVLHLFSNNKIWVPRDMKKGFLIQEFLNELRGVSTTNTKKRIGSAKHDDVLDCVSQLQFMNIISPSEEKQFKPNPETGVYELVDFDEWEEDNGSSYVF